MVDFEIGILILRVAVGIVMIAHGVPKLFWKRKVFNKKWREEYGFPLGSVVLTGILQVVGGLFIMVGIFTSLSALILALNMVVAVYISIWKHGEGFLSTPEGKGWDINFLLIGALAALIFFGDGIWSLAELLW
ncbi:DoxX family protein [Chloroflexota bacterium]